MEFWCKSAFEELHVMLSKGPPCTTASGMQRRECNNTSVFLLRGHLRGWEKMKQGVDVHHLEIRLQACRRAWIPSLELFFLHGLGMAESNWNNVRSVGNLEINCWAWNKQAKGCQKVGKACLDCLQRDLRLRGPKPSQYITGMNLQHGSVPRLEMASGLCYNPSAINGMFSLMQDHDLSFSRRNHCPSPRGLCCIVDAVKGSNVSKQGFSMGQYRQMP